MMRGKCKYERIFLKKKNVKQEKWLKKKRIISLLRLLLSVMRNHSVQNPHKELSTEQ